jgi:hypothetical protein
MLVDLFKIAVACAGVFKECGECFDLVENIFPGAILLADIVQAHQFNHVLVEELVLLDGVGALADFF